MSILIFVPVVLFSIDCIVVFLRRLNSPAQPDSLKFQIWLQDVIVGMLTSGLGLGVMPYVSYYSPFNDSAISEDKTHLLLFLCMCMCVTAFLASLDILRHWHFGNYPIARLAVFLLVFGLFIYTPWLALLAWWAEHLIASWIRGRKACNLVCKMLAATAFTLHGVAFFLPMKIDKFDFIGLSAYATAFAEILTHPGEPLGWLWLANPLFWIGISYLLEGEFGLAAIAGLIAFCIALTLFGNNQPIEFLPAYDLWAGSMLVLFVVALSAKLKWRAHPALVVQDECASTT